MQTLLFVRRSQNCLKYDPFVNKVSFGDLIFFIHLSSMLIHCIMWLVS